MGKNKFRRSAERKEKKDAEKFRKQQRKDNEKSGDVKKPRQKWRKLSDGGIAFGNSYKIGRGGLIGISLAVFVVVFISVGILTSDVDEQGICANPYCHWINTITGSDIPMNDNFNEQIPKFVADEDKDFLPPPMEFLIPFAEARGDDEPTCYSPACKARHSETADHFNTEEEQAKSLNEQILDVKQKIKRTEDVIKIIEEKIRDFTLEIPQDELDLLLLLSDVEEQEDIVKEMKYEYDRKRYEYTDKEEFLEYEEEYKLELKKLDEIQFKYDKLENDIDRDNELLAKEEEFLELAEVDLLMFIDELKDLKISLHKIHRAGNLFSIVLSETCNTMIEQGINTRSVAVDVRQNYVYESKEEQICPTYRDLKEAFDNTMEPISGKFVDYGYDIKRDPSGYDDYWRYYYNMPFWQVITVDPDVDMLHRSMVIEVAANEFTYATVDNNALTLTRFDNGTMSERSYNYYENVAIDDNCRKATVAPDIELIGKVLQYFMDECKGDLDYHMESRVIVPYLSFDKFESQWYKYIQWLNNAIKEYGPK